MVVINLKVYINHLVYVNHWFTSTTWLHTTNLVYINHSQLWHWFTSTTGNCQKWENPKNLILHSKHVYIYVYTYNNYEKLKKLTIRNFQFTFGLHQPQLKNAKCCKQLVKFYTNNGLQQPQHTPHAHNVRLHLGTPHSHIPTLCTHDTLTRARTHTSTRTHITPTSRPHHVHIRSHVHTHITHTQGEKVKKIF